MLSTLLGVAPDPGWTPPLVRDDGHSWMYPICIVIGFAVAIVLGCLKLWKRYKVSTEPFYWFIIIGVPTAIFGARFGSCAIGQTPWSEFFVNFGSGLAIEWGVMLTVLVAFIYFPLVLKRPSYRVRNSLGTEQKVQRVSMWMYFDAIAPAILIAQFIGRWGNYCNQEVYGQIVTDESFTWFLHDCLPGMFIEGAWRQPLFLWEGLGNLAMFFILYLGVECIRQRKAGDLTAAYFLWYGIFRACLEPLRESDFKYATSIVTSIVWAVIGVMFILINHLLIAQTRQYKIFRAIFFRNPVEASNMVNLGWKAYIIQFKINKVNRKINIKQKTEQECVQLQKMMQQNANNNDLKNKLSKLQTLISSLELDINKLNKSIEIKKAYLENYKEKLKEKRAQKVLIAYNNYVAAQKKKYAIMVERMNVVMQNTTSEQEKIQKKVIFEKKLKEISHNLESYRGKSVQQRQIENEHKYQLCVRKPQELIYYGGW